LFRREGEKGGVEGRGTITEGVKRRKEFGNDRWGEKKRRGTQSPCAQKEGMLDTEKGGGKKEDPLSEKKKGGEERILL